MGNGIFGIGLSGLNAAQVGLLTTGHNISNAATPGYTRQQVIQTASIPYGTGYGFIGQGVQVSTVIRAYSEFLDTQVVQAQTRKSQLDTYYDLIRQVDDILGGQDSGLASALLDFFKGVNAVALDPASIPARQTMLSGAQMLVTRFQDLDRRFSEIRTAIRGQMENSVSEINLLADQIAKLNQDIMRTQGAAGSQPANDLLDQRDALVARLSQEIGTTVVRQDDGSYSIFIGNGQALVMGTQAVHLQVIPSMRDPDEMTIGYVSGGRVIPLPTSMLQDSGNLGGYLAFANGPLADAQNALGRIAIGLAQSFNDQHRLGQDLNGALGADFFKVPVPEVTASGATNPSSGLTVSIDDVAALTTSDYRFSFDGTDYVLTRLSDGMSVTTTVVPSVASPLVFDGLSITAATINAGESFTIKPTRNGAADLALAIRDPREIAAAAPIRTAAASGNTGSAIISAGSVDSPDPDLRQPVTIAFHVPYDGQFDVIGTGPGLPALNQVYVPGADIRFNGWTVQITGNPAAGDSFTVGPNDNGTADNRNMLLLSDLQMRNVLDGGTASFQAAYGRLVSEIGNKTRELEVSSRAQASLLAQVRERQQSFSGVNLDEEAANLLRYQQAYQAAGKVIEISSRLFDTLLELGR